jgi:hypothetical protein
LKELKVNFYINFSHSTIFEGVREYCHPQYGRDGEFKGEYTEYREIEVEKENNGYTSLEKIDIEVTYKIWFKYAD